MVSSSGSEKIQLDTPLATSDFLSFAVMNRFGWRSLPLWATAEDCSLLILDSGPQILRMQTICSLVFGAFQPSMAPVLRVSLQHDTHIAAVILHDYTRLEGWPWLECPHFAGQMLILVVTMFKNTHTHRCLPELETFIYVWYHFIPRQLSDHQLVALATVLPEVKGHRHHTCPWKAFKHPSITKFTNSGRQIFVQYLHVGDKSHSGPFVHDLWNSTWTRIDLLVLPIL